jgi:hypothetical protein
MKLNRQGVVALGMGILTMTLAGCRGGGAAATKQFDPSSAEGKHIIQAAGVISHYKTAHKGKAPISADDVKTWVQGLPKAESEKLKFEGSIDDLMTSPRDKEPYQIAPAPTGRHAMGPPRIVVYEKSGVRGKHMVASGMGTVSELDQQTIDNILAP